MSFMNELYLNLDIYSIPFSLRFKKEKVYQSNFGSIFGIISFLIFFLIIFIFFNTILKREYFHFTQSTEMNNNEEFRLNEELILVGLINGKGEFIEQNPKLFTLELTYEERNIAPKDMKYFHNKTKISLIKCHNDEKFIRYINYFDNSSNSYNFLCISYNKSLKIRGNYGDKNYSNLNLEIKICNQKVNSLCYSEEEIYKKLNNSFIVIGFLEKIIDNYDYSNPIKLKKKAEFFPVSPFLIKSYYISYTKVKYESDNGLIFKNKTIYNFYQYNYKNSDFELIHVNENNSSQILFSLTLISTEETLIYKREYYKIKDILANITTWIKLVYEILTLLLQYFIRKFKMLDIVNNVFFQIKHQKNHIYKNNFNDLKRMDNEKRNISYTELKSKTLLCSENNQRIFQKNFPINTPNKLIIFKKQTTLTPSDEINKKYLKKFLNQVNVTNFKLKNIEYFIPKLLIKKNSNLYLLRKLIEEIYINISIETIHLNSEKLNNFAKKIQKKIV